MILIMKQKNNLYKNTYKMENILSAYNKVCSNTKNKRKVANYKQYKCIYISRIYNTLKNKSYEVGPYNISCNTSLSNSRKCCK